MATPTHRGAETPSSRAIGAALATLVVESGVGAAALGGTVAIGWLVLAHLVVCAILAVWLRRLVASGAEVSGPMLLLLVTLVAGPIGALGSLLTLPLLRPRATRSELLDAWYDRISLSTAVDPEAKLAESVLTGRTLDASAPPPARLHGIILRGTLVERQKALGLIARRFDPAYGLALQAALQSPEPVVRVQAAAVAARVRGALKTDVRVMLARLADIEREPSAAADAAAHLDACVGTGLLDAGDRVRAEAAVARLRAAIATAAADAPGVGQRIPRLPASLAAAHEAEQAMIAAGRFRDFRVARRVDALARRGLGVRPRRRHRAATDATPLAPTSAESGAVSS